MLRKLALTLLLSAGLPSLVTAREAVTCNDGSTGKAGRGACSHHGGVAKGAPIAGQPTARCRDGSLSYSLHHTGSCSHHGGVSQWLQ